jgi:hypothetical protein
MRKTIFVTCLLSLVALPARSFDIAMDVADPMYIERLGDLTSRTSVDIGKYFQARQVASFGFSNRFSGAVDIRYRAGADNHTNGFSNIGVMGTYRAGQGDTGATDVLFGFGFGNQGVVPHYSDEVYSVGIRTGRQWTGMTLAATIMTNWIFMNNEEGIAYIDLTPEAYFRIKGDWSLGLGATLRKVTDGSLDQQWLNAKIGNTMGHTGWFILFGYEIDSQDLRIGGNLNMLF